MKIKNSPWVFHIAAGSCGGCDTEALRLGSPYFDAERLGVVFTPSILHADVIFITGIITKKSAGRIKRLLRQAARPCLVVAIGACACGQGVFRNPDNVNLALDRVIPVDVYVPGCPPRPEAIIKAIWQNS